MAERRKPQTRIANEEECAIITDAALDNAAKEVELKNTLYELDVSAKKLQAQEQQQHNKEVEQKNTAFQRPHHYTVSKQATKERTMSMIDPSEWSLEDSQEPYALKDGSEVQLRIIDVRLDKRADDTEYYTVRMEVPSEAYSKDITDWLNVPSRGLDAKRLNAARQKMLHFMQCFKIDMGQLSDPIEDWPGQEGWALLSLSKSDQYGEQNRVSRYIIPR